MTITQSDSRPGYGAQKLIYVTIPGAYKLAMRSDKPIAKELQRWLAHDVVPSIDETGSYSLQPMSQIQVPRKSLDLIENL